MASELLESLFTIYQGVSLFWLPCKTPLTYKVSGVFVLVGGLGFWGGTILANGYLLGTVLRICSI